MKKFYVVVFRREYEDGTYSNPFVSPNIYDDEGLKMLKPTDSKLKIVKVLDFDETDKFVKTMN